MARSLTRRRHGRHRDYDRLLRRTNNPAEPGAKQDSKQFVDDQDVRLGDTAEGPRGVFDSMHLEQGEDESFTFEEVEAAAVPSDIGLTPAFIQQTQSIDFDGVNESLRNTTAQAIGIADEWSVSIWAKVADNGEVLSQIFYLGTGASNINVIRIAIVNSTTTLRVIAGNSAGAATSLDWTAAFSFGAWHHLLAFRESDGTIRAFVDGSDLGVPDTGDPDGVTVMTATDRPIQVAVDGGGGFFMEAVAAQAAMWNANVSAAVSDLFNAGNPAPLNLNGTFGSYTFSGNLAHWWRMGHEASPNLGKDFAEAGITPTIDIEVNAENITDADRVADVP